MLETPTEVDSIILLATEKTINRITNPYAAGTAFGERLPNIRDSTKHSTATTSNPISIEATDEVDATNRRNLSKPTK